MDAQMKRGFLEACVLATLDRRESYGYQIVKDVPLALGLTESTLYPLLKRLEGAGCIAVRTAEHNGRLRKYYRTTEEGRRRIAEFVSERSEVEALYDYVEAATGRGATARGVAGASEADDRVARESTDAPPSPSPKAPGAVPRPSAGTRPALSAAHPATNPIGAFDE